MGASVHSLDAGSRQSHRADFERLLGPLVVAAIDDRSVVDLAINPDGQVFVERRSGERERLTAIEPGAVSAAVKLAAHVNGTPLGREQRELSGRLPWNGARLSADLDTGDAGAAVSIRTHWQLQRQLDDYVQAGELPIGWRRWLAKAVDDRRRVLIAGGTGSGKTTFLNALFAEVHARHPTQRVYVVEQAAELQLPNRDRVAIVADRCNFRGKIEQALRMYPGRLSFGELRGPEASELLLAWSSGHDGGFATVHANSACGAVGRIAMYAELGFGRAVTQSLLAEALDVVVFMRCGADGRRAVEQIGEVALKQGQAVVRPLKEQGVGDA